MLGFNYETQDKVKMKMETLAVAQITSSTSTSNPVRLLKVTGDLGLKQLSPIEISRDATILRYNNDIFSALEFSPLSTVL